MGAAPLVGISSYAEPARWGPWQLPCALLPLGYAEQVAAAGGVPVLLPPLPGESAALERLDALLLSGGGDLDPAGYDAEPHPETTRVQPGRDRAELDLLAAARSAGLPVLGICRGLQILNVSLGGTLDQHLPDSGGHRAGVPGRFTTHPVRVAPGSRLARVLGPGSDADGGSGADSGANGGGSGGGSANGGDVWLDVPTAHHQAIGKLGDGLVATAWAEDGTIEAVELAQAGRDEFLIAVQWHPEQGTDPRLFRALVDASRHRVPGNAKPVPAEPLDSPA
jgi:putative glutamine amidotransferase